MTQELPPPPPADQQANQGVFLPMEQLRSIAQMYHQFKWVGKLIGMKAPKEMDDALEEIASGNMGGANELQNMAQGQQQQTQNPYDIQEGEVPQARIGERILTHDMAIVAWRMYQEVDRNGKHLMPYRAIAEQFTRDGYPISHTSIVAYIDEVDAEMEEHRGTRLKANVRVILIPSVIAVAAFLVGHFFFR